MPRDDKNMDPILRDGPITRRKFLTAVGVSAAATAVGPGLTSDTAVGSGDVVAAGEMAPVTFTVNGRRVQVLVEPRWSLLFVLRDKLGLTGAKAGCERGECGACTVLIDEVPRYACLTLALETQGKSVTTVEGLMDGERLGPVQEAFAEHDAFQCGYCTSGQVVAAEGLLRTNPAPTVDEIRHGMSGNLCRCGAYPHIVKAVGKAAELKRGGGR
jgi:xanthine dehydrogenase YagT iron-sulfur-binding subunit